MSHKRRVSLPMTFYVKPWIKVLAAKRAMIAGKGLSKYIRDLIYDDLGIERDLDPTDIIVEKLEDGVTLYGVKGSNV